MANSKIIIKKFKCDCISKIVLEIELNNGRFSASGFVYDKKGKLSYGGQCIDSIEKIANSDKIDFANEEQKEIIYKVFQWWKLYHCNDMHAGTPEQEQALNSIGLTQFANKYKECCEYLDKIGLLVVRGHKFGCAWLKQEIPNDIQKEMQELLED